MSPLSSGNSASVTPARLLLSCVATAALGACGGGATTQSEAAAGPAVAPARTAATPVAMPAGIEALPAFHMAPAVLAEPSDVDVGGTNVSGRFAPQHFTIDASLAGLATARLTPQTLALEIAGIERRRAASTSARAAGTSPKATPITAAVYTPAQIRAAYGLPELPAVGATVSAAVAASLGAGQTIYLVDADDNPNALSDLGKFSAKFGLPACTGVALTAASTLPLAAAGAGCTFSVAYADSSGVMKSGAPVYSAAWAPEIALDVQWAHAIAPLARLVLIEVNDASTNSLLGGVLLANRMGAGVVSMSFGAPEDAWVAATDSSFAATGMTYVASTGDAGAQVNWPAVSPRVLAVGGTSLEWSGSGTRYEAAWSGSGGGVSAREALPSWQSGVRLAGVGALAMRAVSDVSFNANPVTGQYVALTEPGSTTTNWNAYGGTSIAAPQWAGLVAVANAQRVAASKAMLGDFHSTIYATIANVPGTYAAAFADIVDGGDGSCASCSAAIGYDQATGWGSPNAGGLLSALTAGATAPVAPVVPGGAILAKTGVSLTRSLGITAPAGVTTTYALAGAPTGLTVDAAGELKWTAPATGNYTLTAAAKTSAGKSATGIYSLKIIPYVAPALSGGTALTATVGKAFSATLVASNPDGGALTFGVAGAPSGLTINGSGVIAWASPVGGTYALSVTVADSYGMSSTRGYTLTVPSANHAPTLASATLSAKAGSAFVAALTGHDADGDALTYAMTGAPSGLGLSTGGMLSWARPVKGTYALKVTVRDSRGLAAAVATITLVVKA